MTNEQGRTTHDIQEAELKAQIASLTESVEQHRYALAESERFLVKANTRSEALRTRNVRLADACDVLHDRTEVQNKQFRQVRKKTSALINLHAEAESRAKELYGKLKDREETLAHVASLITVMGDTLRYYAPGSLLPAAAQEYLEGKGLLHSGIRNEADH